MDILTVEMSATHVRPNALTHANTLLLQQFPPQGPTVLRAPSLGSFMELTILWVPAQPAALDALPAPLLPPLRAQDVSTAISSTMDLAPLAVPNA